MKVFLSHAVTDERLVERFRQLMNQASMGLVETWASSAMDGLMPGDALWTELHSNLSSSDKVIAIITPHSSNRPWLLYEAGYVAAKTGAQVIPVLFRVTIASLPLPLAGYMCYQVDRPDDLRKLLFQLVSEVAPDPLTRSISQCVKEFLEDIAPQMEAFEAYAQAQQAEGDLAPGGLRWVDRLKASEVLRQRLSDPKIDRITIIAYTNEVEAGAINRYSVRGKKIIEVFTRSPFDDLVQQQIANVERLIQGRRLRPWDKKNRSLSATRGLEEELKNVEEVELHQWFYQGPPTQRAYVFDGREAIVSYYDTYKDVLSVGGSIHKGMTDSPRLWITPIPARLSTGTSNRPISW